MYVISATHSIFGRSAVKSRSTRSGACRAPSRTVVVTNLRRKVLIDGAGHWIQQERPDEVNVALIAFLREHFR